MTTRRPINRRQFVAGTGTVAGALVLGCKRSTSAGSPRAVEAGGTGSTQTTVFENGVVLPVDEAFSQHEAFAIRGNEILAVGGTGVVRAAAGDMAKVVDLGGRVVLPGFIEPHMHFALMAGLGHWADIGPFEYAKTADALDALARIAAATPPGGWITARQFDPTLQDGPPRLTTKELDAVAADRPVFVLNASGHIAYVNSAALATAGYTKDTRDPPGGEIFRDAGGNPIGMLSQIAYMPLLLGNESLMSEPAGPAFVEGGLRVGDEAAALGITTLCDQATGGIAAGADIDNYRRMVDSGRMHARIRASLFSQRAEDWDESGVAFGDGDAMLRVVGWKIVTDGSNQGFTGRQRARYHTQDTIGIFYVEPEALKAMVLERGRQGWPLVLHGNGDAAIDGILDALQAAVDAGVDVRRLRPRIEHCSILHDEQIDRMKALGASPSFLINHVHYWGHVMRDQVFGPQKVQLLDRCQSVQNAGLRWTVHSDAPVSPLGALHGVRVAVARDLWKEPDTVLAPSERVSVENAIRAVTIDAAWQCHSDHEIGSLEPGKLADFVVLERDPRSVEATAISDIRVLETWLDGARVFRA